MAVTDLTASVWEDDLGKHMRWSADLAGVALQLDIVRGHESEDQAEVAIALPANTRTLLDMALDLAAEEETA